MVRLQFNFRHIGDQVCTTSIPENVFYATGKRSVITDPSIWAFKYNPYVDFSSDEEAKDLPVIQLLPDCRDSQQAQYYFDQVQSFVAASQSDYMCQNFGVRQVGLRHPRLYVYEDELINPAKIVVHTSGSDRTRDGEPAIRNTSGEDAERILNDQIIDTILENYKHYQIVQVGGLNDKPLGHRSIDLRGKLDYWQTAKEIASAARFIGVNSGPMHIANCYPRVSKRIVLTEFPQETLLKYQPGDIRNWLFSWIDPANMYFNKFDKDVGVTFSFTKI